MITLRTIDHSSLPLPVSPSSSLITRRLVAQVQQALTPGWTLAEVRGAGRDQELVHQRRIACFVARQLGLSYPAIGRLVNRHHTSVLYLLGRRR